MTLKVLPKEIVAKAVNAPGSNESLAVQIAGQPADWRSAAFRCAERRLDEAAETRGFSSEERTNWLGEQVRSITMMVEDIDACQGQG